jgi:DNA-directed RNA polymerase subunit M/transcription elongation factor TFIIS
MKICKFCESVMTKSPLTTGQIIFQCRCQYQEEGQPEDSLMDSGVIEVEGTTHLLHDIFIDNSPYDLARNICLKTCYGCGLNFLTLIRVGDDQKTMYICDCGYRVTQEEYLQDVEKHGATKANIKAEKAEKEKK